MRSGASAWVVGVELACWAVELVDAVAKVCLLFFWNAANILTAPNEHLVTLLRLVGIARARTPLP